MSKLILTLSLVLLTTFSFAQTFDFGIKAGANLSNASLPNPPPGSTLDHQYKTGFQAGVIADIDFDHFGIQPGLFFITKGGKFKYDLFFGTSYAIYETNSINFNYLELPINLLYKLQATPMVRIYAGGGPYVGYCLSGTLTQYYTDAASTSYFHDNVPFERENPVIIYFSVPTPY